MNKKIGKMIVTMFGVGHIKYFPGTFASFITASMYYIFYTIKINYFLLPNNKKKFQKEINFLNEPNLLQLSVEIFENVVNHESDLELPKNLLSEKIKDAETINFILADGLGYKNLISLESSLRDNVKKIINTTFPSSTNVAISTLAMMSNPIEHGLIGYYMYDKNNFGLINALNWNSENQSLLNLSLIHI